MSVLLHNAKIWTGSEHVEWMTFDPESGYVLRTGTDPAPLADFPPDRRKDLSSRHVLPGFHESHIHLLELGKILSTLNLLSCASIEGLQQAVAEYAAVNPQRTWIFGNNWNQEQLGCFPTRLDLDAACPDRPVFLRRVCIHVAILNSKALQLLGINENTPQPEGGMIDIFPPGHTHAGQPTGILRENAMTDYVDKVPFSSEEKKNFIQMALQDVLKNGVTSAHTLEEEVWDEYCELADDGALPLRVFFCPYWSCCHSTNFPPQPDAARGPMLSCNRAKLFTDGALGVSTAALSQPYLGTCNCGILLYKQEKLASLVSEATRRGFRLEIHAIGDAAAESALDALEEADVAPEKRPVFAHCQVLREDLLPRLAARGVIATIQPQFVVTDGQVVNKLLPPGLREYSYAWRTLLSNNVLCAGSSDAPVEEPKPLLGMYDSIFRQIGKRGPDVTNILQSEERLTVQQAVDLYTKAGAYTACREQDLGQLRPGYQADLVVLNTARDPWQHPEELLTARIEQVWVAGQRKL